MLLHPVEILLQPLGRAALLDHLLAVRRSLKEHANDNYCPISRIHEIDDHAVMRPREIFHHQPFRWNHLFVAPLVPVVGSIRSVHNEAPVAAWPHLHPLNGRGKASRPPPLRDVLGLGPHTEDQFAWSLDEARRSNLAIRKID